MRFRASSQNALMESQTDFTRAIQRSKQREMKDGTSTVLRPRTLTTTLYSAVDESVTETSTAAY